MAFPTDPKFVSRAERSLGRRLPKAIVAKLIRVNGGSVVVEGDEWLMHPVLDDSDRRRLKRTANDIVRETAAAREWPRFPLAGVSIGANGVGDHLVLLPAPDVEVFAEPIYMWEHETGELREIAQSFGDLVRLADRRPIAIPLRTVAKRVTIDRPITAEEIAVIRATLERAAVSPGYESLAAKLEQLRAVERCQCGCESVEFYIDAPDRPSVPLGDGTGQTAAGGTVGIIVWGTEEGVTGIEVYDLGAGDGDLNLPVPNSIRPW